MGDRYLTDLADVLWAAGAEVIEYVGWQTRARSSGGYDPGRPNVVMVHHTASDTTAQADADYMCKGSADRPLANLMLDREGWWWVLAAGCTNTNGKGGPIGPVPQDSMNTYAIGVEACNDGVGEPWPDVQQDAYIAGIQAICAHYAIPTVQVYSHNEYAPDRKIDPAGPARWPACNSSGTWNMDTFRTELGAQDEETDMTEADWERLREIVRNELSKGAVGGSGGDPDYETAWGETNAKMARSVNELINRSGGPPPEWS